MSVDLFFLPCISDPQPRLKPQPWSDTRDVPNASLKEKRICECMCNVAQTNRAGLKASKADQQTSQRAGLGFRRRAAFRWFVAVMCMSNAKEWGCTAFHAGSNDRLELNWKLHRTHARAHLPLLWTILASTKDGLDSAIQYTPTLLPPIGHPISSHPIKQRILNSAGGQHELGALNCWSPVTDIGLNIWDGRWRLIERVVLFTGSN